MTEEPCPTCGRGFETKHGVRVHHKKAHGESIAPDLESRIPVSQELKEDLKEAMPQQDTWDDFLVRLTENYSPEGADGPESHGDGGERGLHRGSMDKVAFDGDSVNETINQAVTMLESLRESHANLNCDGVHVTLSVREVDKVPEDELPTPE